jgi:glycosyltransferase involved in cell wall biosynthesis
VKIAIVANTSWNIYNFRMNLIRGFKEKGFEVICIAPEDRFTGLLKKENIDFYPVKIHSKGNNPIADLSLLKQFRNIYSITKPDIILQYTIKPNIYGTLAAKLCNIPTINTVTGLGTVFLHDNWVSKVAQSLYKFSFRFAGKVLFQNSDDQQFFVEKALVSSSKTTLVHGSGVNTHIFHPSKLEITSVPFRFLMAARLLYDKGIREYAKASLLLYEKYGNAVECHLIGSVDSDKQLGIPEEELSEWTQKYHIKYHTFSEQIAAVYQFVHVVVLPSYREGVPKTLLEAAACAKPLIATDVAGCREVVINNWNGLLCKPKDAEDLFDKMVQIMEMSKEQQLQMSKNSYEFIQQSFSDKIVFNEYFCLVKELLAGNVYLNEI